MRSSHRSPLPCFWFSESEKLAKPVAAGKSVGPLYLKEPEWI